MIATLALLLYLATAQVASILESNAQALSPDEKLFAYTASDGSLRVVSLPDGTERWRTAIFAPLRGGPSWDSHGEMLAWSPDGSRLATISPDGKLTLLRATDGAPDPGIGSTQVVTQAHWSSPFVWRSVRFLDGGRHLLVIGPSAQLIDAANGTVVHEYKWPLTAHATSDDQQHFALGESNGVFAVYSGVSGDLEAGPVWLPLPIEALAFDASANRIAVGVGDGIVRVFSLPLAGRALELDNRDYTGGVGLEAGDTEGLCFAPDGKSLLSSTCVSGTIRCWNLERGFALWAFDSAGCNRGVVPGHFLDGGSLVVLSAGGSVIDARTGESVRELHKLAGGSDFSAAGHLAWTRTPGRITIVDPRTNELVCEIPLRSSPPPPLLRSPAQTLSDDERLFAYSVNDGTVHIATLPEGKGVVVARGLALDAEALAFSPDGRRLAAVDGRGRVLVLWSATGTILREYPAGAALLPVWTRPTIAFVDEGTRLLVTGAQACVRLLELGGGEPVREFLAPREALFASDSIVQAVAVSSDRRHLAVGDAAGWLSVRSTHSGDIEAGPYRVYAVHALAFDPSGTRLAVGSSENSAWVFQLDGASAPVLLFQDDEWYVGLSRPSIGSVCFSADGMNLLTTAFEYCEVRLWDLSRRSIVWRNETTDVPDPVEATSRFSGEHPVVVLAHSGAVLDSGTGSRIGTLSKKYGSAHYSVQGRYAWAASNETITLINPGTATVVCKLPLAAK